MSPTLLGILAGAKKRAWTPASLGNLKAWYDASDTSTITVSGTSVTQWNDKSANGYNLTQATGTKQPQSGTATLNSKNVIDFDGGDRLVAATASDWKFLHDGTKVLVGAVVKFSDSGDPQQYITMMSTEGSLNTTLVGAAFALEDRPAAALNNCNRCGVVRGVGGTRVSLTEDNGTIVPSNNTYITHLIDSSNATAADRWITFVDNGSALKSNTLTGTVSTANPTYPLNVGWCGDESLSGLSGFIAEIVIASGTDATEANRVELRDYLKTKWGL